MRLTLLAGIFLLAACTHQKGPSVDYAVYGGNKQNNRYSALRQIDLTNVKDLQPAWTYNSADTGVSKHEIQCQPIVVDGVLYGISPSLKLFAVRAATGEEIWKFDPFKFAPARFNQSRGWLIGRMASNAGSFIPRALI